MLGPSQPKHERAVSIFVLTEAAAAAGLVPAALQPVLADAADVATATAIRSHTAPPPHPRAHRCRCRRTPCTCSAAGHGHAERAWLRVFELASKRDDEAPSAYRSPL